MGEVSRSHHPCICYVALNAYSDELEARIATFSAVKDGDVASSPSPLMSNQRSANSYSFAVGKVLPFASPLLLLCCTKRFQRRAGSIHRCVFSYNRGRRCLVALCAMNRGKNRKQIVFFCVQSPQLRLPAAWSHASFALSKTVWNHQSTRFYLQKGRRCPIAHCAMNKGKDCKQVVFARVQNPQLRLPEAWSHVPFAYSAKIWKHQSTRFYLQKRATLPYRPLRHGQRKKSQVGIFSLV